MKLPPPVEPDDDFADSDSVRAEVIDRLLPVLAQPEDAAWIADALIPFANSLSAETGSVFDRPVHFVDTVCRGVRVSATRGSNLLALLRSASYIAMQRPSHDQIERDDALRRAIHVLLPSWTRAQPPIDFNAALTEYLGDAANDGERSIHPRIVQELVRRGSLSPATLLDLEHLGGASTPGDDHPRNVLFWTQRLGGRALNHLLPIISTVPDERVGELLWPLVERLHFISEMDGLWEVRRRPTVGALRAWLDALDARAATAPRDALLLRARLLVARVLRERRPGGLSEQSRKRLLDAAHGAFDGLRRQLQAAKHHDAGDSERLGRHYNAILEGLGLLGDPIRALRAMLVVVRHIPEPVSGSDLRYWHESEKGPEDQPPIRWRWFADSMVGTVHWYARVHRGDDPDLVRLRENLAKFFLDRLKTKDESASDANAAANASSHDAPAGDDDAGREGDPDARFVEPSPIWRRAYMRAIRELRVNPDGRGHHVLHWLSRNDPHDELRREAATAYGEVKRDVLLAPGVSPRRAVIAALWWIRQAQRQHLDLPVNPKGAQRTRQKESRKTKEVEELELSP